MYQAPEVSHLLRAVEAVKRAIATQKKTEPEANDEHEESAEEREQANEPK